MRYTRKHNILLVILLIGLINLFNIYKYGLTGLFLTSPAQSYGLGGVVRVGEGSIAISIITIAILLGVINVSPYMNRPESKKEEPRTPSPTGEGGEVGEKGGEGGRGERKELEVIVGLSIIGGLSILYSNELIIIYLGLELYNYSTYVLYLKRETIDSRRVSIVYIIISSILSGIILLSFLYIYKHTGTLCLEYLVAYRGIEGPIGVLILALLIKLGVIPFTSWVVRLYKSLDRVILLFQLVIPKILLVFLVFKFLPLYPLDTQTIPLTPLLLLLGTLSLVGGGLGGLYHSDIALLLAYSSFLNTGYALISLSPSLGLDTSWVVYNFLLVYIISLLGLFSLFFLSSRTPLTPSLTLLSKYPPLFFCMLVLVLSLIGIPPLGGFYSKVYILLSFLFSPHTYMYTLAIGAFIAGSIISTFLYIKFLLPSSYLVPRTTTALAVSEGYDLASIRPITSTYILASTVGFLLTYSFYLPIYYPFLLSL